MLVAIVCFGVLTESLFSGDGGTVEAERVLGAQREEGHAVGGLSEILYRDCERRRAEIGDCRPEKRRDIKRPSSPEDA